MDIVIKSPLDSELFENYFNKSVTLFRPPYGFSNPVLNYKVVSSDFNMILWDVFPRDYKKNSSEIFESIKNDLKSGSIIVLHDTSGNRSAMISVLPEIIDYVRETGFEFGVIEDYLS